MIRGTERVINLYLSTADMCYFSLGLDGALGEEILSPW